MDDVDVRTRETAVTLLAASKMQSPPSSGLSTPSCDAAKNGRTPQGECHNFADTTLQFSPDSLIGGGRKTNTLSPDGNPKHQIPSTSSPSAQQHTVAVNQDSHNTHNAPTTTIDEPPPPHPKQQQSFATISSATIDTTSNKAEMSLTVNSRTSLGAAAPQHRQQPAQYEDHQQQQQQQQQQHQHHAINVDSMLSMSSIGFGIDSSPAAALGDATPAALRAIQDAMERSTLRLPVPSFSSSSVSSQHPPQHPLLQIKVKLGVPAKQDGTGEPMLVNIARLCSFLPSVIPVLPIQVVVGGLYLPSENQGSPSICTSVACITLQSQATAMSFSAVAPLSFNSGTQPRSDSIQDQHHALQQSQQHDDSTKPAIQQQLPGTQTAASQLLERQWMPAGQPIENRSLTPSLSSSAVRASSNIDPTPGARVPHAMVRTAIAQARQSPELNFLATTTASSPPQAHVVASGNITGSILPITPATTEGNFDIHLKRPRSHPQLPSIQAGFAKAVRRSNSMEMLAMISEEIRLARDAASLGTLTGASGGPATLALQNRLFASLAPSRAGGGTDTVAHANRSAASLMLLQQRQGSPEDTGGAAVVAMGTRADGAVDSNHNYNNKGVAVMAISNSDEEQDAMRNGGNYNYKKLPPGVTTKKNQRLFVKHRYRDYSRYQAIQEEQDFGDPDDSGNNGSSNGNRSMNAAFPVKLHETLTQIEKDGYGDIIGWLPHGRSFKIHKQKEFAEIVLPRYFVMTKKSSFLRQLNLYSFNRFSAGPDQGSYYHEKFLKGLKFLCRRMSRQKVNGNRIRSAGNPDDEPNLALFPVCPRPPAGALPLAAFSSAATSLSSATGIASTPEAANTYSLPIKREPSFQAHNAGSGVRATTYLDGEEVHGSFNDHGDDEEDDGEDDDDGSEGNYHTTTSSSVEKLRALRTA